MTGRQALDEISDYFRHTAANETHSRSWIIPHTILKTRQNWACSASHTVFQALVFRGEECQFKGCKLSNSTFFCLLACIPIFFSLSFTVQFTHVPIFPKHITFGFSQMTTYKYIYFCKLTRVNVTVCHGSLFLSLSKGDNAVP